MIWSLINLGSVARYRGEFATASELLQAGLDNSETIGFREGMAWTVNQLGAVHRSTGNLPEARALLVESLGRHRDLGDRWRTASVLEELANLSVAAGSERDAARLLGAAHGVRDRIGVPVPGCERADHEQTQTRVRSGLRSLEFARCWQTGFDDPSAVQDAVQVD